MNITIVFVLLLQNCVVVAEGKPFSLTRILISESALQNVQTIEEADESAREATCCKRKNLQASE
uniref:Uncharacterized protein n=1 Tax=Glossina pallidipes TaxID=7398 RepID=A0A1B0ABC6_GLOPL